MERLPENWPQFFDEASSALDRLFGRPYADAYRAKITPSLQSMLGNSSVKGWGVGSPTHTSAIGLCTMRDHAGIVSWLHVLKAHEGQGIESELVETTIEFLRNIPCGTILLDMIPLSSLEIRDTMSSLGFQCIPRELMAADSAALGVEDPSLQPRVSRRVLREAADVLVQAYRNHPGRMLHPEVYSEAAARRFLAATMEGEYGAVFSNHIQVAYEGKTAAGFAAGASAGGDTVFLFHVAVAPTFQQKGAGTRLIRSFAHAAANAGYVRVVLGVNTDNPARQLYRRLGFVPLRAVDAFVWRDDGIPPSR